MAIKTKSIIHIQGEILEGGIADNLLLSSVLKEDITWNLINLKRLQSDINEIVELMEAIGVADKLSEDDDKDALNDSIFDAEF